MILEQFYLGCLSQASYLIGDEETGTAAVVDPRRDVDDYLEEARSRGLVIRHVFLTHFHADFVSGHLELHERCGATIYLGAAGDADYDFTPLSDGDVVELGKVRVKALATPGHTPESTSYLVYDLARDPARPQAVLTGDTLFVGDVGRPDLMASRGITAEDLAGSLYDSLRDKLLKLPDDTVVYPGHGAGSMCGKNLSAETQSTIGVQRADNYALQPMGREAFIRLITADQPAAPAYFAHDAEYNRRLRSTLDRTIERSTRPLSLDEVVALRADGAHLLDTRPADDFAAGHLRGSVHVALDGRFASWAGTLLEQDRPIVVIAAPGREHEAIVRLGRIGSDRVQGYLADVPAVLRGHPEMIARFERYSPAALAERMASGAAPFLLDIRGSGERAVGYLEGSAHIPLDQLLSRVREVPDDREVVVLCATGYRSTIAASLIRREGVAEPTDLAGGTVAWQDAGLPWVGGAPGCSAS